LQAQEFCDVIAIDGGDGHMNFLKYTSTFFYQLRNTTTLKFSSNYQTLPSNEAIH